MDTNYHSRMGDLLAQMAQLHFSMAKLQAEAKETETKEVRAKQATEVKEKIHKIGNELNNKDVVETKEIDVDVLRKVATAYAKAHGKDVAKAIIGKYADNLASVKPEQRADLMAEMQ